MEIKSYSTVNIGSEKSFGLVFSIFFIFLGLYFYTKTQLTFSIFFLILSISFFIFSFVKPSVFKIPNLLWSKLGILLGMIVSPIVLFIIFIFLVTPIGLFMRLIGKDLLNEKISKKTKSYWIKRKIQMNDMKDQF
tara:strand:- start:224 stop:628 length:405 start_codon:yes stop_codon:yes gene_type:complete